MIALVKDHEVYDKVVLGMSLRERLRKTLERNGFEVRFFREELDVSTECLIIFEPVLLLERDFRVKEKCLLSSNGFVFGACLSNAKEIDFRKISSENGFEKIEVRAVNPVEKSVEELERAILSTLVKKKSTGSNFTHYDGVISTLINRRISLRISKFLAKTNVSPNQITVMSFLLSLLSIPFFLVSSWISNIIGGLIVQLHNIVDGCDGEIARLKFMESKYGAWLDGVLDRCSDFLILLAVTYSASLQNQMYWIVGSFAIFASMMIPYTGDKFVAVFKKPYENPRWFEIPATRDVRLFIVFIFAILNKLEFAVILIAILGNAEIVRRIIALKACENQQKSIKPLEIS